MDNNGLIMLQIVGWKFENKYNSFGEQNRTIVLTEVFSSYTACKIIL